MRRLGCAAVLGPLAHRHPAYHDAISETKSTTDTDHADISPRKKGQTALHEGSAPAPAAEPQGRRMFGDERDAVLFEALAEALALDRDRQRREVEESLTPLKS
jgi:hypothetical protein